MNRFKELNFAAIIPELASRYKDNIALSFVDETPITYEQMWQKINAVRSFFEAVNLKSGDKVIILSQNMPNWGITYFALQCSGIIAIPVLPDFNEKEVQNVLEHSEADAIFVSENLQFKLKNIDITQLKTVVKIDDFTIINTQIEVEFKEEAEPKKDYSIDENKLSVLLYTSGTTGMSKGVMLSQKNIIFNAIQAGKIQTINEHDRFLSVLPLSHTYENTLGLILPIINGAQVHYMRKAPTSTVLIDAMKKVKPDLMLTVPMIIEKVYKQSVLPKINKKSITRILYKTNFGRKFIHRSAGKKLYHTFGNNLKFFGIGGAKLDGITERFLREAKFPYAIGYGLTETSPIIAGSNPQQTRYQAIGSKVIECELRIENPDPVSGEGEILARGPNIMQGYYKNEVETRKVLNEDGWFRTGDLGVFDKDGWLSHKGRLKNMIVGSNGENIYPEEMESLINNFKHVLESIVIQKDGKLVAMVHFNIEEIQAKIEEIKSDIQGKFETILNELALELKSTINPQLNKFSQIQLILIQQDPFQKTATKKIKRYLYQ